MYMLVIHNIKISRKRQVKQSITHPVPEFQIGNKVLVRNHSRDLWDPIYDSAYRVVIILDRQ